MGGRNSGSMGRFHLGLTFLTDTSNGKTLEKCGIVEGECAARMPKFCPGHSSGVKAWARL